MSFVPSEGIRPQRREDFGHPVVRGAPRPGANHRPGFIDETPPSQDASAAESDRAKTLVRLTIRTWCREPRCRHGSVNGSPERLDNHEGPVSK